jgi:hypothetical protein
LQRSPAFSFAELPGVFAAFSEKVTSSSSTFGCPAASRSTIRAVMILVVLATATGSAS